MLKMLMLAGLVVCYLSVSVVNISSLQGVYKQGSSILVNCVCFQLCHSLDIFSTWLQPIHTYQHKE